jgi:hypothetical protein
MALAEDHRNDIMSNSVAIVTAAIATEYRSVLVACHEPT